MPSVSANLAADGVWIRFNDGQLWEHTSAGLRFIDFNVLGVSSGLDSFGAPAAFIRYRNNFLFEFSDNLGFRFVDSNVLSMSGSQNFADTVFIQYVNGFVYEHRGIGTNGLFTFVDTNAVSISTGINAFDQAAVFIRYRNGQLWEWSPANHFSFIDFNVQSISASQVVPDTTFIVYNNTSLFLHSGLSLQTGFRFIDSNVASVSAGKSVELVNGNQNFVAAAFIDYLSTTAAEWLPVSNTFLPIDVNVVALSASQNSLDTVFLIYANTALFEHVGRSAQSGFFLLTTNVTGQ
jgi:hypothetical protein